SARLAMDHPARGQSGGSGPAILRNESQPLEQGDRLLLRLSVDIRYCRLLAPQQASGWCWPVFATVLGIDRVHDVSEDCVSCSVRGAMREADSRQVLLSDDVANPHGNGR